MRRTEDALYYNGYEEGYEEGKHIGRIEFIIHLLKSKKDETIKYVDEEIQDGTFTEYQKQQALFYIRMGITEYHSNRKRRRA